MADPEQIAALRDFNRFYTSRLGMTRHGLHSTTAPAGRGAGALRARRARHARDQRAQDALAIDAGQLSRLVKRLQDRA